MLNIPRDGTLTTKVTQDEVNAFDPLRHAPPCTAWDFKLHLEGTCAHPWNKAVTTVFVEDFCSVFPQYNTDETEDHFKIHLDTLIRKYKLQQRLKDNINGQYEYKKESRKNARKVAVSSSPSQGFTILSLTARSSSRLAGRRYKPFRNCKNTDG